MVTLDKFAKIKEHKLKGFNTPRELIKTNFLGVFLCHDSILVGLFHMNRSFEFKL